MEINPKLLAAFVAIIEYKSFEKAAQSLCITQSAVSQRIKLLEVKLGQSVLIRSPKIMPTKAGYSLLKYARNLAQLNDALNNELSPKRQQQWRQISIASNADTLSTWLLKALAPWCNQHKVLLDIKIDDQDETHKLLHSGEVLGCISSIKEHSPQFNCAALGDIDYFAVASPQFMNQYFAQGINRNSFYEAPLVRFNHKDQLQHIFLEQHFTLDAQHLKQHIIPSADGYIEWIKKGMGFGMAPMEQISHLLQSHELVLMDPTKPVSIPLYWLHWGVKTELGEKLSNCLLDYCVNTEKYNVPN